MPKEKEAFFYTMDEVIDLVLRDAASRWARGGELNVSVEMTEHGLWLHRNKNKNKEEKEKGTRKCPM